MEVRMHVFDAVEMRMVAELVQMLEQKRKADEERFRKANMAAIERQFAAQPTKSATVEERAIRSMEQAVEIAKERNAVASVDGAGAALDTEVADRRDAVTAAFVVTPPPSDIEVARAMTVYAQKNGLEKARELLDRFGAKRVLQLSDDQRREFIAAVSA
jgi:hypothetical protein